MRAIGVRLLSCRAIDAVAIGRPRLSGEPPGKVDGSDWRREKIRLKTSRSPLRVQHGMMATLKSVSTLDCKDPKRSGTSGGLRGGPPGRATVGHTIQGKARALRRLPAGTAEPLRAVGLRKAATSPADDAASEPGQKVVAGIVTVPGR